MGSEMCIRDRSSDYAEAIECGATMVRIGSSLFGPRDYTR